MISKFFNGIKKKITNLSKEDIKNPTLNKFKKRETGNIVEISNLNYENE